MLIRLFSVRLGWLPTNGLETWKGLVLPVITMALPASAGLMRMTRTTMLETIRQDYIRTVRAKGAPESIVILRHALKNALLPVVTGLGLTFGGLLGGSIIVEMVFGLPGLGTLTINAIRMKDVPQVLASTIFLATIFCTIILIIDILYAFIDPRIKASFSGRR
jgi:peptide/nickel transport system permease protein